jgi:hypothetical protein
VILDVGSGHGSHPSAVATDAGLLATRQVATALGALDELFDHGRNGRHLAGKAIGQKGARALDRGRQALNQLVAELEFCHATLKPLSGQRSEFHDVTGGELQRRLNGAQASEDSRSAANLL